MRGWAAMRLWTRNRDFRRRFPPPAEAFAGDYGQRHTELVCEVLASPGLLACFADEGRLPDGYGIGFDERVVEYPWVYGRLDRDVCVLDAGSTLNHAHILDRFLTRIRDLTIVTLAPEQTSYPERGVAYVYADLRNLPFADGQFDAVVSISTLEHVGMDNAGYGGPSARDLDPDAELERAAAELVRVLAPRGTLLITVPVGRAEDHGWFRQLDRQGVDRLVAALAPTRATTRFYAYTEDGWRHAPGEEIDDLRYHEVLVAGPAPDRAAAARAVACIEAVV
jgi:SAM-dependent methyltransferase